LGLQFLDFSTILYGFYKLQAKHKGRERIILRVASWKDQEVHNYALDLHKTSWKFLGPCNVALGPKGRRGRPDSGAASRIPARPAAGMAGEVGESGLGFA
jgi:hypothetical protein